MPCGESNKYQFYSLWFDLTVTRSYSIPLVAITMLRIRVRVMVFNATFNNISAISWH